MEFITNPQTTIAAALNELGIFTVLVHQAAKKMVSVATVHTRMLDDNKENIRLVPVWHF